jgi:hypothetical protein
LRQPGQCELDLAAVVGAFGALHRVALKVDRLENGQRPKLALEIL